MKPVEITIENIEKAKSLEYNLIHNRHFYSALKFTHSFDHDCQRIFTYEDGKCYIQRIHGKALEKQEVPYPKWINDILHHVVFNYEVHLQKHHFGD